MNRNFLIYISFLMLISVFPLKVSAEVGFFPVQSVDTMKYSRDEARGRAKDEAYDREIERQIKDIAAIGATHVAIGTPYDTEFIPFMTRWVKMARKYKMKVWFRGNLSGWENWFDYPTITAQEHTSGIVSFIKNNSGLFEDGDIFSSCPECENGALDDPRKTGQVDAYRNFLINEYNEIKSAFSSINKKVTANYYSMNGDVARLVMDRATTKALDGIVTIDHYVKTPEKLDGDVNEIAKSSGGKIVLGEFGAPIPDIHGNLTQSQQADWIKDALSRLSANPNMAAVNYWTGKGASTSIWNEDGSARQAVSVVHGYFRPLNLYGEVTDAHGTALENVTVKLDKRQINIKNGNYRLPVLDGETLLFTKKGYVSVSLRAEKQGNKDIYRHVTLSAENTPLIYTIYLKIKNLLHL